MLNFFKSLKGTCLEGKFYHKFEGFTIFSYSSPHLYTHNVELLRERTDLRIYQRHKISSKSLNGPSGRPIALTRGGNAYLFLVLF